MGDNQTFVRITNRDIYNELLELKKNHDLFYKKNSQEHAAIISRQDQTNGKVKKSTMLGYGALSLTIILLGFLFQHLSKIG